MKFNHVMNLCYTIDFKKSSATKTVLNHKIFTIPGYNTYFYFEKDMLVISLAFDILVYF